ncbi:MAG: CRTAC1 family protein, partial [Phycisphaerales bacterium]
MWCCAIVIAGVAGTAHGQFTDITASAGVNGVTGTYGAAWGDYNNDGYPDLWVSVDNKLFTNNGNGTFSAPQVLSSSDCCKRAGHWGDYDNDGDLDLLHTRGPYLYRNDGGGTFTTQNNAAIGLSGLTNLGDAGWIDYNEDGWLDIWGPDGTSPGNHVFRNDGDGTFTDQGVDALGLTPSSNGETTVVSDYDADGHTDVLYRGDSVVLWRSNGNGTFTNTTAAAGILLAGQDGGYNGTVFGDYDNDGDLDLAGAESTGLTLYRNNGNGSFTDVTATVGVDDGGLFTGVAWADYDHDGDLDLYAAHRDWPNHLWRNNGDGTFTDVAAALGVADAGATYGTVFADFDLDGDLDLFVVNDAGASRLYRNDLNNGNYFKVKVTGEGAGGSPRDGTGSRVEVWNSTATTLLAVREITGGEGYGSHPPHIAHFGLDPAQAYTVKVTFTSGKQSVRSGVIPQAESIVIGPTVLNQTIEVREAAGVDLVQSGGTTSVSETGPTADTYTLALLTQPTADVTITVDPDTQTDLGAGAGTAVVLTFTPANWNTAQVVTVTAVDDGAIEGNHTSTITHSVAGADPDYNGLVISNVTVSLADNDVAGVTLSQTGGLTAVHESPTDTDTYSFVLTAEPIADVILTADPDTQTDLGAGPGQPVTLVFTSADWSSPQVVTVRAVNDAVVEDLHTSNITHSVASADAGFNGLVVSTVTVAIADDDGSVPGGG